MFAFAPEYKIHTPQSKTKERLKKRQQRLNKSPTNGGGGTRDCLLLKLLQRPGPIFPQITRQVYFAANLPRNSAVHILQILTRHKMGWIERKRLLIELAFQLMISHSAVAESNSRQHIWRLL